MPTRFLPSNWPTSTKVYKENDPIFKEGTPGDVLYVILDGTVDIVKHLETGQFKTLARFTKDHIFGEMTLIFKDVSPRSASAIARDRCRLLMIFKDDFQQLVDFGSIIAYKVTMNLCRILSKRLDRMNRDLANIAGAADELTRETFERFMNKHNQIITAQPKAEEEC